MSDLWLPIRINGDVAVLKGIMKEMLAEERKRLGAVFELDFIRNFTAGFDRFIEDLEAASWDDILISSGMTREQIRTAAEIAINSKRSICCWAMGLDVKEAGLTQGQIVDITSHFGEGEKRYARHFQIAPYPIARGCTATYFPEGNVLVPINSVAERSNTPTSKFVVISVTPATDTESAMREIQSAARENGSAR